MTCALRRICSKQNKEMPQNFAPHRRTYGNQDSVIIRSVTEIELSFELLIRPNESHDFLIQGIGMMRRSFGK